MGLFDIFKKKDKDNNRYTEAVINNVPQTPQLPFDITYKPTSDGKLQVDFYDRNADFKKFYDTTRLIVNGQPIDMAGHEVYQCEVSWYGHDDCQMLDRTTGEFDSLRAKDCRGVLIELDLNLLQTDPYYCNVLMKGLLDKPRVEKYLANGMQEITEQPSGEYIGAVMKREENGYGKFFSKEVGKAAHNTYYMKNMRRERQQRLDARRQQSIADKKAQIARLQQEIAEDEAR